MSIYSLNKVMLIGNLGIDPSLKQINAEKSVVTFSLATSESWLDKQSGQRTEKTEWHNIEIWGSKLDMYKNLKKGSKVYVEGRLQTQSYEKDGEKKYSTKIVADHVVFLDGKSGDHSQSQTPGIGWSNTNQSANQGGWGNSGGNQGGSQGGSQGGWGNQGGSQGGSQGGWGNQGGSQGGWGSQGGSQGGNQGGWGSGGNQGGNQGGWGSQGSNGWDNAKSSQAQPAWSSGFNEQALPPKSDDDEGDGNLPF